jgi:hypothetical protein
MNYFGKLLGVAKCYFVSKSVVYDFVLENFWKYKIKKLSEKFAYIRKKQYLCSVFCGIVNEGGLSEEDNEKSSFKF